MNIRLVALDLSLKCTGFVDVAGRPGTIKPADDGTALGGTQRICEIRDRVLMLIQPEVDLVIMEDIAYGGHDRGRQLAGLAFVVRAALYDHGYPFRTVGIGQLKKYATGNGQAPKEEVLAAAIKRIGYTGHSLDEADALWLWAIGRELLGRPSTYVPRAHREWLEKLT